MFILRVLVKPISVIIAVLAGNWLGGALRSRLTGEPVQSLRFRYTTPEGRTISNIPVVTKFYPALLIGLLHKPHSLRAFLAGVAAGALVDDRAERLLWERFEKVLLSGNTGGLSVE
ncbi:MAG: hypothetical protein JXR84_16000 [Anaerolineae bacterium]|nr:hypothetical protein [Anaerolineae bacterium]